MMFGVVVAVVFVVVRSFIFCSCFWLLIVIWSCFGVVSELFFCCLQLFLLFVIILELFCNCILLFFAMFSNSGQHNYKQKKTTTGNTNTITKQLQNNKKRLHYFQNIQKQLQYKSGLLKRPLTSKLVTRGLEAPVAARSRQEPPGASRTEGVAVRPQCFSLIHFRL